MSNMFLVFIILGLTTIGDLKAEFRGNLNNNPFDTNSVANPYGRYGSKYSPDSVNNPYGAGNPYANPNRVIVDENGNFRGNLNNNRYDPDSASNPYGRYGSKFSQDSINNEFGAGSPFAPGLQMYDR